MARATERVRAQWEQYLIILGVGAPLATSVYSAGRLSERIAHIADAIGSVRRDIAAAEERLRAVEGTAIRLHTRHTALVGEIERVREQVQHLPTATD